MGDAFDFLSACAPGTTWRTRDRRAATITGMDPAAGIIQGTVTMFGPCVWRADGVYAEAPFGAPGPLDLAPPCPAPPGPRKRVSAVDQLTGEARAFCCD